jgi:hypothetical protein
MKTPVTAESFPSRGCSKPALASHIPAAAWFCQLIPPPFGPQCAKSNESARDAAGENDDRGAAAPPGAARSCPQRERHALLASDIRPARRMPRPIPFAD